MALALVVLSALYGLLFQLTLPSRAATDADYQAAAETLLHEAKPGDAVLLFPWWTERARLFLPDGLPVVGYLHSEKDPLLEHPRIWVLSEPHLPRNNRSGFDRAFLPDRTPLGPSRTFGNLALELYGNGRYRPILYSVVDAWDHAQVYLEHADGSREPCMQTPQGFQCPQGLHVAAEWHELFYEPRRCLWMHPPGGDTRLVVETGPTPNAASMLLEAGIIWELAPKKDVTPLHVGVEDASTHQTLTSLEIPGGVEGFQQASWTPPGNSHGLRLWTQSDRPEARDACVELRALGASPGGQP